MKENKYILRTNKYEEPACCMQHFFLTKHHLMRIYNANEELCRWQNHVVAKQSVCVCVLQ